MIMNAKLLIYISTIIVIGDVLTLVLPPKS